MATGHIVFAVAIVVALVSVASFFLWRQSLTYRELRTAEDLGPEDRAYLRNQVWRRVVCSVLMLLLAGFLTIQFVLEPAVDTLLARDQAQIDQGKKVEHTEADRRLVNVYGWFWYLVSFAVLSLLTFAGWDYIATRNYARRQYSKIREGRRTMIEEQLARLRSQRNGHG
jgi:NADH:ubiquinone oxidoreductase subunit 5 (subunit L)/multisubunit Na+/H+ antiporter MnhA subunit